MLSYRGNLGLVLNVEHCFAEVGKGSGTCRQCMVMTNAGGGVKLPSGGEVAAVWSGSQEWRISIPALIFMPCKEGLGLTLEH